MHMQSVIRLISDFICSSSSSDDFSLKIVNDLDKNCRNLQDEQNQHNSNQNEDIQLTNIYLNADVSLLRAIEAFLISHWMLTLLWMITVTWHQIFQIMHTRLHDRKMNCKSNDRRSDMTALEECISKRTDKMHWLRMQRMCRSKHWSFRMKRLIKCRESSQNIQSNHDEIINIVSVTIVYSDTDLQTVSRQITAWVMRLCITQRQRKRSFSALSRHVDK